MLNVLQKKIFTMSAGIALLLAPAVALPVSVYAANGTGGGTNIQNCVSNGSDLQVDTGTTCTAATTSNGTNNINNLITDIVNVFSAVVGIISVIMIIFGGFQYITSGGDSGKVSTAKTTIIYAIVGLVVVAFAQFIVQFVLNKVVGTS